jgi:hypothetical protein
MGDPSSWMLEECELKIINLVFYNSKVLCVGAEKSPEARSPIFSLKHRSWKYIGQMII